MAPVAEREMPQNMVALERANAIRLGRARLKREIKAGRLDVVEVLDEIPECARTMPTIGLLTAQRQWGETRAKQFLQEVEISALRPLGDLTYRQRSVLIDALKGKGA